MALSASCSSPSQTPCNAGDKQCSGNGVQTCGSDHTWSSAVLCQNQACVNGACTGSCAPGAKECSGNGFHSCGADGTWGAITACTNQGCVEGACSGMCNPGDKQCSNNAVHVCGNDGMWGTPSPCTMQACVQGACMGVCAPDSKRCNGNGVETCGSDGTWGTAAPCTGMTCDQGACVGMCTVNDARCQANVVQSCADGGVWTDMATCPFVCTGGGQCTGVCVPGDKQCVGDASQTCDGDGGWGPLQNCVNEGCVAGACTGSCVRAALHDGGLDLADIPSMAFTLNTLAGTTCPNGSNPDAGPMVCISEMNWGQATLDAGATSDPTQIDITGTVAMRVQDIQIHFGCADLQSAFNGNGACPGGAPLNWTVSLHLMFHPASANSLTWFDTSDSNAQINALSAALQLCGVPTCNAICCASNVCLCALAASTYSSLRASLISQVYQVAHTQLINRVQQQLCLTGASACPTGATVDANNVCMYPTGACAPRPSLFATCP
jgi:hypothetical protein